MHVAHDAADHQPGAQADENDQCQTQGNAHPGGRGIVVAGHDQGLLEIPVGIGAEFGTQVLGAGQVGGHTIQTGAQVIEGGTCGDEFLRGVEGVIGVARDGTAPGLQLLQPVWLRHGQLFQRLLLALDVTQYLARFVEGGLFAGCNGVIEQLRYAGELEDHPVGFFQNGVTAGFKRNQPRVGGG